MESSSGGVFTAFPAWRMNHTLLPLGVCVLCSVCVSSSVWYLAVLEEELDPSHGSNHVMHEAVMEDCKGLVRVTLRSLLLSALAVEGNRLLSVTIPSWEAKNFLLTLF